MKKSAFLILLFSFIVFALFSGSKMAAAADFDLRKMPDAVRRAVSTIRMDSLGGLSPKMEIEAVADQMFRVRLIYDLKEKIKQDDWQINLVPAFEPDFHWAPHLTPTAEHVIDQHAFRSPALIVSDKKQVLILIPDIEIMEQGTPVRWYMDLDAPNNCLTLGMAENHVREHVLFVKNPGASYPAGKVEFGFYIMVSTDPKTIANPFRKVLDFLWTLKGRSLYESGQPIKGDLRPYVDHTYRWAFETWKDAVWQEFEIDGRQVGAPVFIVNVTQSPNFPGLVNEREFRSIWNQAWFSSLRSASGLYRYAKRTNNTDYLKKANLAKELALAAPRKEGFFYGVAATEMEQIEIEGRKYNRSRGWETLYWGNSNRNPYTWDARKSPFHILDMSWTALLMLRWYEELDPDERLLEYAETYAKSLVKLQDQRGFFPGWLDLETLKPLEHLNDSPETSMSVMFLLKLAQLTDNKEYEKAALKAMQAVAENIVPVGRWEDFETYWSCCRYGSKDLVGRKVERNNMYKQCSFSMFWTAEALLECYQATGNDHWLQLGQRTLDELLMMQASWQPPYIYVNALGGFGVMNCDGEWNDSRESLFAELIIRYGELLKIDEYQQRGIAALKSSFVMMYCPENPKTKEQWEKVWRFFAQADYGFTMENYAHGGRTSPEGEGMGEFTIYDWGNGAAAEAYNRIFDHYESLLKSSP